MMYRLGFNPWDYDAAPAELIEASRLGNGRALELGWGTGRLAVELATLGWDVTSVDNVDRAIEQSKAQAKAVGAKVNFVAADVTRLTEVDLGEPFDLVYDNKCLQGLPDTSREAYAKSVAYVCQPGATYLLFALTPGHFRRLLGLPRGIDSVEVGSIFADHFEMTRQRPASRGLFEAAFYELRRASTAS